MIRAILHKVGNALADASEARQHTPRDFGKDHRQPSLRMAETVKGVARALHKAANQGQKGGVQ